MDTIRSIRVELRIYKTNNKRLLVAQEKQVEVNAIILQILLDFQRKKQHDLVVSLPGKDKGEQSPLGLGRQEYKTNGAEGSIYKKIHKQASAFTMRGGTPLSTP